MGHKEENEMKKVFKEFKDTWNNFVDDILFEREITEKMVEKLKKVYKKMQICLDRMKELINRVKEIENSEKMDNVVIDIESKLDDEKNVDFNVPNKKLGNKEGH